MTPGDDPQWLQAQQELTDLRLFFYQCPVGLFEIDDDGLVRRVNPAAVRMLAPVIGSDTLAKLFPLLSRLAPEMVRVISQDRHRMGPLAPGQRMLVPVADGRLSLEILATRVAPDRVMIVLVDVTAERRLSLERARLLQAEQTAHSEAAAARDQAEALTRQETAARLRLQALQSVTAGLATALTSDQIADVLATQGVGLLADHGAVALLDPAAGQLLIRVTADVPAGVARHYARVPISQADQTPLGMTARTGQRVALTSFREIAARWPLAASSYALTGTSSLLVVPVRSRGHSIGALAFGFRAEGPVDGLVAVAETLAGLTGQALERARLYEAEHAAAHQLQQALLPDVPSELPGAGIGVRYRPAANGHDVGGDWYDVFQLPGGTIGFAVGDVVGHDLRAAITMGRLQQLLRHIAARGAGPAQTLHALDDAYPAEAGTSFATLGYAEYSPADNTITYACAGHPPPLLVTSDGVRYLNEARSLFLGSGFQRRLEPRSQAQVAVLPGAMIVWYTDGLVERRDVDIDRSLARLAALATQLTSTDPQHWCDRLLTDMTTGHIIDDDVVIACLRLRGSVALAEQEAGAASLHPK